LDQTSARRYGYDEERPRLSTDDRIEQIKVFRENPITDDRIEKMKVGKEILIMTALRASTRKH
jgi:hypothetical protein